MKSNSIQNITMITCKEEMVKIKSNSGSLPPEKHVEEGEYQVQHSPEHHGDHLHAEKGRDKVQHNTEHNGDHLHEEEGEDQVKLNP